MSIVIASRRHDAIAEWMHRVADRSQRPLNMLIVSGPVGCGKSTVINQMAAQAKVTVISLGSDDSDCHDSEVVAVASVRSFERWRRRVQSFTLDARCLFIDDAEALLMHAPGGRDGLSAERFVDLGQHQIPVVLAVSDWYAGGSLLRQLRTKEKDVHHVRLVAPSTIQIQRQLLVEFPNEDTDWIAGIANESNGDLRRARLDVRFGLKPKQQNQNQEQDQNQEPAIKRRKTERSRAGVIGSTSSLFDQCKALLGVSGIVPSNRAERNLVLEANAPQLSTMMRTHTASVVGDIETAAAVSDVWADLDQVRPQYRLDGLDEELSLVCVPRMLALSHFRNGSANGNSNHRPSASDIDFAQPLSGSGAQQVTQARRQGRDTVALWYQYRWLLADRQGHLVSCPRLQTAKEYVQRVDTRSTLARLWEAREYGETLRAIQTSMASGGPHSSGKVAVARRNYDLLSAAQLKTILEKETRSRPNGARRPWDRVRTIVSADAIDREVKRSQSTEWHK